MPVGVFFFFLHLCAERDDNQASWTRTAATVLLNIPLSLPQTCRFSLSDGVKVYVSGFRGWEGGRESHGAAAGAIPSGWLEPCTAPRVISHYMLSVLSGLAARYFTYQRGKNPTGSGAPLSPNTLIGSLSANLLPPKHCLGFN